MFIHTMGQGIRQPYQRGWDFLKLQPHAPYHSAVYLLQNKSDYSKGKCNIEQEMYLCIYRKLLFKVSRTNDITSSDIDL